MSERGTVSAVRREKGALISGNIRPRPRWRMKGKPGGRLALALALYVYQRSSGYSLNDQHNIIMEIKEVHRVFR